ncbi:MAG: hypothetical protein ACF8Q5_04970 [Phycisphaerales bacterium JB040]
MPNAPRRTVAPLALACALALLLGGCASSSEPDTSWEGGEELRFSADAQDPTERAKEGGWYRFRPQTQTEGAESPLDPDARTHGFGAANNDP